MPDKIMELWTSTFHVLSTVIMLEVDKAQAHGSSWEWEGQPTQCNTRYNTRIIIAKRYVQGGGKNCFDLWIVS